MGCHDIYDAVERKGATQLQAFNHLDRSVKAKELVVEATQTCRKTFFLRNPGNTSYQMEASSCWTLEWATKAFCLKVIASFSRSRLWMSPTCNWISRREIAKFSRPIPSCRFVYFSCHPALSCDPYLPCRVIYLPFHPSWSPARAPHQGCG